MPRTWLTPCVLALVLQVLGCEAKQRSPDGNDSAEGAELPSQGTTANGSSGSTDGTNVGGPTDADCGAECGGSVTRACVDGADAGCSAVIPCDGGVGCGQTCPGCTIGGECVASGTLHAINVCLICDPVQHASDWSPLVGASCDDGLFCTVDDACDGAGTCTGTARVCEDGVACNGASECDEDSDTCVGESNQCGEAAVCDTATDSCTSTCDGCLIEGVCIVDGAEAPGNPCSVCDRARSTVQYTPAAGRPCGSGPSACSLQDSCDAQGRCVPNDLPANTPCGSGASTTCDQPDTCDGAGRCLQRATANGTPCDDGAFCTVGDRCQGGACTAIGNRNCGANQLCNENIDQCQCQGCLIAGACLVAGASSAADPCQLCDPARSTTAFSASTSQACRAEEGSECSANADCRSNQCVTFYGDGDGDGFAAADAINAALRICASNAFQLAQFTRVRPASRLTTDCLDTNAQVHPQQTEFFTAPVLGLIPAYDYDCDGIEVDPMNNKISNCSDEAIPDCTERGGWSTVPACGQSGGISPCGEPEDNRVCTPFPGGPSGARRCH